MDEQFDKKLTNRIREVFDNYEHPPAEAGWAELRKKFPAEERKNKVAWLWLSSAAAVLLLFFGVGIWLKNKPENTGNMAMKPAVKQQPALVEQRPALKDTAIQNTTVTHSDYVAKTGVQKSAVSGGTTLSKPYGSYDTNGYTASRPAVTTTFSPAPVLVPQNEVKATNDQKQDNPAIAAATVKPDSQRVELNKPAVQQMAKVETPVSADNVNNTAKQLPAKTMADLLNEDKPTVKKGSEENKAGKRVNFSVYAATYFNYATGSANQINAGAGFTSDIRISKNIKLSTGVSLAQNTLSYDNTPPPANNGYATAVASPQIKRESLFSAASSVPEFKNYNASLIGLDVPINIKYEFNPQKSDTYMLVGLSSGTFIDERYTYRYAYQNNSLTGNSVTTQDQTTTNSFNSFYFARMLNVSFGFGYPLGKRNKLFIEPFVKYPLAGLGAQDLRFGAGGLNLKLNFSTSKK